VYFYGAAALQNWKASSENWMASFKEVEGLLQRVQVLYTYKFLKHCAASLMDYPQLRFCLLDLCQQ